MHSKIICLLILVVASLNLKAQTVTIYRAGTATSPTYSTIKGAVAAAMDNDSLVLSADVFTEKQIIINKPLFIKGTIVSSTNRTVIDAISLGSYDGYSAIKFNNLSPLTIESALHICDLDIKNGYATSQGGGAIYAGIATILYLEGHSRLYHNEAPGPMITGFAGAPLGGAVYSDGKVIVQDSVEIFSNKASLKGGAIFAKKSIVVKGASKVFNNITYSLGGGLFSEQSVTLLDNAKVSFNKAENGGGIYADSVFANDSSSISFDSAKVGGGIYATQKCVLSNNAMVDSNVASQSGGGILFGGFCSLMDSSKVIRNQALNGAGIYSYEGYLEMYNTSLVGANHAKKLGGGITLLNSYFIMKDSAFIGLNTTDTNYAAAIHSYGNNDISITGGQIIGNYSTDSTYTGKGMALFNEGPAASSSIITINNARVFNPRFDNSRHNEFYNAQAVSAFISDSTWWGESDTTGIIYNAPTATVALRSWIVCEWILNGGLPIDTAKSFPLEAHFSLYTGASIPTKMFWMLEGYFSSDSGTFSPSIAPMNAANIVGSVYTVPTTTRGVYLNAVVDADSFKKSVYVIGLGIAPSKSLVNGISVFPNPATNYLTIRSTLLNNKPAQLTITDMLGKRVLSQELQFTQQELTIPINVIPGNYVLNLWQDNQPIGKQKIIVQ